MCATGVTTTSKCFNVLVMSSQHAYMIVEESIQMAAKKNVFVL
jgi:hypothetical protein